MAEGGTRLVGDIGGTNVRLALVEGDGEPHDERKLPVRQFPGLAEAALDYLGDRHVDEAVFAVATPVAGDAVAFTNSPWQFSQRELKARLKLERLAVINDFVAQAAAIETLDPADLHTIKPGAREADKPAVVLGPGTGLGVALIVAEEHRREILPSEAGHMSFAPNTPLQTAILTVLIGRFGHVSTERVLSGPGLVNLATALGEIHGTPLGALTPAEVSERAADGSCPLCREAFTVFSQVLGAAAGDLVLAVLGLGGVFLTGGLSRNIAALLDMPALCEAFLAKGRFRDRLSSVPIDQVMRAHSGLAGAAAYGRTRVRPITYR